MRLRILTFALVMFGMAPAAMAANYICRTQSNYLAFEGQSEDREYARNESIALCVRSTKTTNEACHANIRCVVDGPTNEDLGIAYKCTTRSRYVTYGLSHRELSEARTGTFEQCNSARLSDQEECQRNLKCEKFEAQSRYSCAAGNATTRGDDLNKTLERALQQCSAGASACRDTALCKGGELGSQGRMMYKKISCSTAAGDSKFSLDSTSNVSEVAEAVRLQCRRNANVLTMGECEANLKCDFERMYSVYRCEAETDSVKVTLYQSTRATQNVEQLCVNSREGGDPQKCVSSSFCATENASGNVLFKSNIQKKKYVAPKVTPAPAPAPVVQPAPVTKQEEPKKVEQTAPVAKQEEQKPVVQAPKKQEKPKKSNDDDSVITDLPFEY